MRAALVAGLLSCALTTACGGLTEPGGTQCTTEARSSVTVTVVDGAGATARDGLVRYSANGGPEQEADCVGFSDPDGCDRWVAGYEIAGAITVKAVSGDGARHAETTVEVGHDECHVKGVAVTLQLQ